MAHEPSLIDGGYRKLKWKVRLFPLIALRGHVTTGSMIQSTSMGREAERRRRQKRKDEGGQSWTEFFLIVLCFLKGLWITQRVGNDGSHVKPQKISFSMNKITRGIPTGKTIHLHINVQPLLLWSTARRPLFLSHHIALHFRHKPVWVIENIPTRQNRIKILKVVVIFSVQLFFPLRFTAPKDGNGWSVAELLQWPDCCNICSGFPPRHHRSLVGRPRPFSVGS